MPRETDNEVGYGKPPKHSQFKKGQSGNPRGRPRDTENLKMLVGKVLDEKIVLTENGKRSKISLYEAVIKQLVRRSAQGDYRSTRDLIQLVREFEHEARSRKAQETRTDATQRHVLVLPHNNRDPRDPGEVAALIKASDEYHSKKQREQECQTPANENEEEVPDKGSSAA
jgi:hypothetical protein